jgi:hypothetical protein
MKFISVGKRSSGKVHFRTLRLCFVYLFIFFMLFLHGCRGTLTETEKTKVCNIKISQQLPNWKRLLWKHVNIPRDFSIVCKVVIVLCFLLTFIYDSFVSPISFFFSISSYTVARKRQGCCSETNKLCPLLFCCSLALGFYQTTTRLHCRYSNYTVYLRETALNGHID